jgi:hypothetical protein
MHHRLFLGIGEMRLGCIYHKPMDIDSCMGSSWLDVRDEVAAVQFGCGVEWSGLAD